MRTKTLLLTAALCAAGVASTMAQPVYSVNVVGYVNKPLPVGLSLIANQLNATPNNSVQNLFGTPPGFVTVSKFNPAAGSFDQAAFDPEQGWGDPTAMVLNPGQGAFVDQQTGGTLNLTFVGEVVLNSTVNIPAGLNIYSSVIPQRGDLNALEFPIPTGAVTIFKFTGSAFASFAYDPELGGWSPNVPTLEVSEGVFIDNSSGATMQWTRNFPVGN